MENTNIARHRQETQNSKNVSGDSAKLKLNVSDDRDVRGWVKFVGLAKPHASSFPFVSLPTMVRGCLAILPFRRWNMLCESIQEICKYSF